MRGRARFTAPEDVVWIDDVELYVIKETEKAFLVGETETSLGVWIPKSQIKVIDTYGKYMQVSIPDWLAKEKGIR